MSDSVPAKPNKPDQVIHHVPPVEGRGLYRTLVRIALPISLQGLITTSLNFVDTLMVGHLGETELAAVGVANQVFFVHIGILFGLASGCGAYFAQLWGVRDLAGIRKVIGFTITLCLSASLLLFFLPVQLFPAQVLGLLTNLPEPLALGQDYLKIVSVSFLTLSFTMPFTEALRATHQTRLPLYISIVVFSTNTLLNYLLIFGKLGLPAMGVRGAAIATLIARLLELILVGLVVFGRKNFLAGPLSGFFNWTRPLTSRVFRSVLPVTVNEAAWAVGMATYMAFYGRMGVTEFASVQAARSVNGLFIMAIFSLGDAFLILVGQRIGMGREEEAFRLGGRILKISVGIGVISGVLLILLAAPIAGLFHFTPDGERYTRWLLIIFGTFIWLILYNGISITGVMRCGGDTTHALLVEAACVWLIGVPLVYVGVFILHLPVFWVVLLAQTEEVAKGLLCRRRFHSKKWINRIINDIG